MHTALLGCLSPGPQMWAEQSILICVIGGGGGSSSHGGNEHSAQDVLQRLKLAAQIRHDTGKMGPHAVESMSKCGVSGMRLSCGYL